MGVFHQLVFPATKFNFPLPRAARATGLGPNLGGRVRLMYLQLIDSFQFDSEKPLTELRDMSRARANEHMKSFCHKPAHIFETVNYFARLCKLISADCQPVRAKFDFLYILWAGFPPQAHLLPVTWPPNLAIDLAKFRAMPLMWQWHFSSGQRVPRTSAISALGSK